ncbi:MAG: ABC transporter permease [Bacteroidales bacterium]|nr:ABC transporter permease [Bacteroidales bacterium]
MFKFFIKISLRNLFKHKTNTLINIISLSLGITILLLISIYTLNELSVDDFHKKAPQIYKVSYGNSSFTPGPLSGLLNDIFPEIQNTTHIETHQLLALSPVLNYNNSSFEIEKYYSADSSFFEIFDFELLEGNLNSALQSPFSMILTEKEAIRIFNNKNPLGEIVKWKSNNDVSFTVRAVIKNLPPNSSIQFNGLISASSLKNMGHQYYPENWGYATFETYLLLKPNVKPELFEQKIKNFLVGYYKTNLSSMSCNMDAENSPLRLHPLKEVYFKDLIQDTTNRGNIMLIWVLIAVGIVIMLLSMINYINLFTARTSVRTKEIGIQKVVGCKKMNHVLQYLVETSIISFFASIAGFIITILVLNEFSQLMNLSQNLSFPYSIFFIYFIPGVILLGIVAGIYPAFYVTSQNITDNLKNNSWKQNKGFNLRYLLIIIQFSSTILLIATSFFIYKQVDYMKSKNIGINTKNILNIKLPFPILMGKKELFRDQLQNIPGIKKVSFSSTIIGKIEGQNSQEVEGKKVDFASLWVDAEFIDLFNIQLIEGRFFSKEFESDVNSTALLNESALKEFAIEDPFKIEIKVPGGKARVVGIVKDFNYKSLHNSIEPLAIIYLPGQGQHANIVLSGDISQTLTKIEKIWDELAPGFPFNYNFLDSSLANLYKKEEQMRKAISYFSLIAILIAFLGLFGLSVFVAERRVKEICVRKINGAKVWEILFMLNKDIAKNIAFSFLIACPLAYYIMNDWLQNFAYKTELSWWIFALAGLITMLIALLTVSWQTWRAARRNPVEALRYE